LRVGLTNQELVDVPLITSSYPPLATETKCEGYPLATEAKCEGYPSSDEEMLLNTSNLTN